MGVFRKSVKIKTKKIKAVIFDLNGVIINDEKYHQEAWKIFCYRHKLKYDKDFFLGRTQKEILAHLFKKLTKEEFEKYSNEKTRTTIDLVKQNVAIKPDTELINILRWLHDNGFKLAITTSSRRTYTNFIVNSFNISSYFDVIVTADDIRKGKPDPEIYLKTAKLLNVSPDKCLVIEDTLSGIKSAKSASMKCIAITTTYKRNELKEADKIINSFNELIEIVKNQNGV